MANLKLADKTRDDEASATKTNLAGAKVRVYTGTQPTDPDDAITTQTLLVEITLSNPAVTGPTSGNGLLTLIGTPQGTAAAGGTAAWARLVTSTGDELLDGDVSTSGGGGNFIISSTTITSGQLIQLSSFTYTRPQ